MQRVPQVLEVREVGWRCRAASVMGCVTMTEKVWPWGRRGQLHRLVQAARPRVDLDELASGLYRHVQVRLALSVRKHSQVDVVVLIADAVEA